MKLHFSLLVTALLLAVMPVRAQNSLLGAKVSQLASEQPQNVVAESAKPAIPPSEATVHSVPTVVDTYSSVEEEAEVKRLLAAPPAKIPIQASPLASAIAVLAEMAGMNSMAPDSDQFPDMVTISATANPYLMLCELSDQYRFTMQFRRGIWRFVREQVGALVTKTYVLHRNNPDMWKASNNSFQVLDSVQNLSEGGGSGAGAGAGSAGGTIYTQNTDRFVNDIRDLIGLPSSSLSRDGKLPDDRDLKARVKGEAAETPGATGSGVAKSSNKVVYVSDQNAVIVTCTRAQHELVAEYLRVIDVRPAQIRVESRFFQTNFEPSKVAGIDPTGWQPGVGISNIKTDLKLGKLSETPYPKAVLSSSDLNFQLQALESDSTTKLMQNPWAMTQTNREVYFSVGDEEPFVTATSTNGNLDAGFGSTQSRIAIRRIGTSVNIVPTLVVDSDGTKNIRCIVHIELGVLKAFRHLNTVDVPVVSSQKYEYIMWLHDGETLAFGGLSGITDQASSKKTILLGDIPVVGYLFKSKSSSIQQKNIIAYFTVSLVDPNQKTVMPPIEQLPSKIKLGVN